MLSVEVIELTSSHAWVKVIGHSSPNEIELRVDFENGSFDTPWVAERDFVGNIIRRFDVNEWEKA